MLAPLLFAVLAQQPETIHVDVGGMERQAIVVAPAHKSSDKPPVVFMFHGHGGSAEHCIGHFHVENQWPAAVVVYPEGMPISLGPQSPEGLGWQLRCDEKNSDIQFFDKLREKVLKDYDADPKKEFAMGFSNGGMFVYTLWALRGDEFAAFALPARCCSTLKRR